MKTLLSSLALACALVAPVAAHDFTIDQSNEPSPDLHHNIKYYMPLGQEFVPTKSLLDVVELHLMEGSNTSPVDLKVRIHRDAVDGEILGESPTFTLPAAHYGVVHIDLDAPVAVTPGERCFLEVLWVAGQGTAMIGSGDTTHYDAGRAMLGGSFNFANDFWFRTGLDSSVPAVSRSWGSLKQLYR